MRLSEAIRLGSMLGPQAYGELKSTRPKYRFGRFSFGPAVTEYCAMGAAHAAAGVGVIERPAAEGETAAPYRGTQMTYKAGEMVRESDTPREWWAVSWRTVACPLCDLCEPMHRVIPHLNDKHRWTREHIADFVAATEDTIAAESRQFELLETAVIIG